MHKLCRCTIRAPRASTRIACYFPETPRIPLRHVLCLAKDLATQSQPQSSMHAAPLREEDSGRALDEYIGPGLQLMEQILDLDGRELKLIVPRSSDAVMDFYIDAERWERDPYWCRCWPSALALGRLFTKRPELAQSLRVCEIGAGLGIAGIAAAFAGASQVVLTDREPLALECARRSAIASGADAQHGASQGVESSQIVTEYLDWTDEDPGLGKFDVVIACDVLYEREAIEPVAIMAIKLLSNKGARFILADPESRTRAHRQEFIQLMIQNKKHPMCVELSETTSICMDNINTPVQVLVFRSNWFKETIGVKF